MTNFRPWTPPASLTARMVANTAVVTGWEIRFPSGVLLPEMEPKRMESPVTPMSVAPPLLAPAAAGAPPIGEPAADFAAGVFLPPAAAVPPPAPGEVVAD